MRSFRTKTKPATPEKVYDELKLVHLVYAGRSAQRLMARFIYVDPQTGEEHPDEEGEELIIDDLTQFKSLYDEFDDVWTALEQMAINASELAYMEKRDKGNSTKQTRDDLKAAKRKLSKRV